MVSGNETEVLLIDARREKLVTALRDAIWDLRHEVSASSLWSYCSSGLTHFFEYLDDLFTLGRTVSQLSDIDKTLMES